MVLIACVAKREVCIKLFCCLSKYKGCLRGISCGLFDLLNQPYFPWNMELTWKNGRQTAVIHVWVFHSHFLKTQQDSIRLPLQRKQLTVLIANEKKFKVSSKSTGKLIYVAISVTASPLVKTSLMKCVVIFWQWDVSTFGRYTEFTAIFSKRPVYNVKIYAWLKDSGHSK